MNFSAGQNADRMLGAPGYGTWTQHAAANMANGIYGPNGVAVDGSGSVYVTDSDGNRVMRWGATPATDGANMTNVLMKADTLQSSFRNGCNGNANGPEQVMVTGDAGTTRLAVADDNANRVVLFTSEQTTDGPTGTVFLGQPDATSCSENRGGAPASNTLDNPRAAWTDGVRVAVADTANNRVLLWDSFPATGAAASRVLGQADFVSIQADRGGAAGSGTLDTPRGVWFDGSYLYVADSGNDRVLVWTGWPGTNGAAANYVVGAPDFSTTSGTCTSTRLDYPVGIAVTGTGASHRLAITSEVQNRVVVLDAWPTTPASSPTFSSALGQPNLTTCNPNQGLASASAATLRSPSGLSFDPGGALWVADYQNHRVLRFPSLASGTNADRVLGKASFTSSVPRDGQDDNIFPLTIGATVAGTDGTRIAVTPTGGVFAVDPLEATMRMWPTAPAVDNEPFTIRYGQLARDRSGWNGPGSIVSAASLAGPLDVWTDGTKLLIADTDNDRVLVWTSLPTTDTDPPDYVLGQPNFTATSSAVTQTGVNKPGGVASDGVDVFVSDTWNDRVLVYRNFWLTPANGKAASIVLGQANFTSGSSSNASGRMWEPMGLSVDSRKRLAVADHDNNRILVWNDHSTVVDGQIPDAVIGQASATANGAGTITEDAGGVQLAGGGIVWTEDAAVRVLDPLPTSGFTTAAPNQIGTGGSGQTVGQNRLDSPSDVSAANGSVWVANGEHARVMRWTDTTAPTLTAGPTATVRCDGTATIAWTTSESTTTEIRWDTVSRASWAGGYANQNIDSSFTGLTHSYELSFATAGTKYVRVRAADWASLAVESGEISFTVPTTCSAPTAMLADDANAQLGTGRANPSTTNTPPIKSSTFHSSWLQSTGVTMNEYEAQTWSTPPEHAGGLWRLDNSTAADVNSSSPNPITWTGGQAYTTGKFGTAAIFDGTTQYGTIADHASIRKGNAFTVDLWFKTSSIANEAYPLMANKVEAGSDCGGTARCNYSLEWDRAGNRLCASSITTSNTGFEVCRTAVGLLDNQWHHMAMTVSASNELSLFVDGVLADGPVAMGAPAKTSAADSLYIGRGGSGGNWFQGSIDELRFSPVAYDAAAILGYYRTKRAHAEAVWDTPTVGLGTDCLTTARCVDQTYAGPAQILRDGARYWQRTRLNTLNNDYWTDWGVDWFETAALNSLTISVGGTIALGTTLPGVDAFGSSTIDVTTNGAAGYQLLARDESNTWGLERVGGGASVNDRQDGATAPAAWPSGSAGYGVTVRSATGDRLPKWGTAPGGFAQNNVTDNFYTGLESTTDVVLHDRQTYGTSTDTIVVTWRLNASLAQAAGSYDGVMTLTVVANP